jgi:hypothetical protein
MTKSVKVKVEVPEGVSEATKEAAQRKAHETAVLHLWQSGDLSTRDAASDLGLAYHEFLDLLTERGIPVEDGLFDPKAVEEAARQLAARKP